MRKLKNDLIRARKLTIKKKLQRAEEKRLYLLQMKAKKAADEEMKAHEILFINKLEEQNRKHDIFERYEKQEARRHNLEGERIKKQEEQRAKELAAEVFAEFEVLLRGFNGVSSCFRAGERISRLREWLN